MKNIFQLNKKIFHKSIITLFILFFAISKPQVTKAQSVGVTFGGVYEIINKSSIIGYYQFGYVHSFGSRLYLGLAFQLDKETSKYDNEKAFLGDNVYGSYYTNTSYWGIIYDCKYFLSEIDERPVGFYIGSNYRFGKYNNNISFTEFYDNANYANHYPNTYNGLNKYQDYAKGVSLNTFGLKFGFQAGPYFDIYYGVNFNLALNADAPEISKLTSFQTPDVSGISHSFGIAIGLGK